MCFCIFIIFVIKMVKKHTLEYVENYFKEHDCKLLETKYINSKTLMKYRCICGNISEITFSNFKQGGKCMKCSGNEKLTFEYVQNYFKEQSCQLLEKDYINTQTLMKYICICGNISNIRFNNFQQSKRCMKCSGSERLTLEFVKNFFQEQNCELLETKYLNNQTKMKYKCKCGNKSNIKFDNFQQGKRCKECGDEKSAKSSVLFKDYILPSDNIIRVQGYENIALDELVKIYKEDDIITNRRDMPEIKYFLNGKERRYYPDIWIKSENIIIEVKSDYTYKKDLIKNIMKALATRKLSYNFEWWIYDNKMNKLIL